MTMNQTVKALSFGAMLAIAALSAPVALADDTDTGLSPFSTHMKQMTDKEGMISKKDFMAMMEKRWNMMDKANKGKISTADAMKIFSDKP